MPNYTPKPELVAAAEHLERAAKAPDATERDTHLRLAEVSALVSIASSLDSLDQLGIDTMER